MVGCSRTAEGGCAMAYSTDSKSAAVRAQLGHPVIDGDGHWLEPIPIFLDFLRDVGGASAVDKFMKKARDTSWYEMTPAERMERRPHRPTWWGEPGNTLDRATAMVPRLFHERLDDFGIDFALVYTSLGLFFVSNPDEELRRSVARAVNRMNAEMFRPYARRMTPAAVVPMHTPREAIEEATYAVRELGLKVIMIANHVRRPVPAAGREVADPVAHARQHIDSLGLESPYDYDPFWKTCVDLKVAVTGHSGSMGWNGRESIHNFTYNHIGHFANASHAFAKALLLGGVTRRFPQLRFACEADDVTTAWAFDRHGNHRLRPIFSSDVGHFDVVDMTEVLEEAYELVEHGLITEHDLREFVFSNPARLHTAMNPDFFKGTVVEDAVRKEISSPS